MDDLKNVIGYRKEIDHALERIAAIEKHLGISPQLDAHVMLQEQSPETSGLWKWIFLGGGRLE